MNWLCPDPARHPYYLSISFTHSSVYIRRRLDRTVLASGACCLFSGSRRIGKRVKLPHGPATVKAFDSFPCLLSATAQERGKASKEKRRRSLSTSRLKSGDLPEVRSVSMDSSWIESAALVSTQVFPPVYISFHSPNFSSSTSDLQNPSGSARGLNNETGFRRNCRRTIHAGAGSGSPLTTEC